MGQLIKPVGTNIQLFKTVTYTVSNTGGYSINNIDLQGIGYISYDLSGTQSAYVRQFGLSFEIVGVGTGDSGIISFNCPTFAISSFSNITVSTDLPMAVGHYVYGKINAGTIQIVYDIHTSCTVWCIGFGFL